MSCLCCCFPTGSAQDEPYFSITNSETVESVLQETQCFSWIIPKKGVASDAFELKSRRLFIEWAEEDYVAFYLELRKVHEFLQGRWRMHIHEGKSIQIASFPMDLAPSYAIR